MDAPSTSTLRASTPQSQPFAHALLHPIYEVVLPAPANLHHIDEFNSATQASLP